MMIVSRVSGTLRREARRRRLHGVHRKYQNYTMIPGSVCASNLEICLERAPKDGCIVECGVWRGGMSAAIADVLPGRSHFLFDSFEGLPPAKEIDGTAALDYQKDKNSPVYHDNCRAERSFAEQAMSKSEAKEYRLVQGWFNDTVPGFTAPEPIAILRLDGDWYDSTMECLRGLYPQVQQGGLILIDDYYTWDGCARAVHDYLSAQGAVDRIQEHRGVCFLVKRSPAQVEHSKINATQPANGYAGSRTSL